MKAVATDLQLTIDWSWAAARGYVPVRLTVRPTRTLQFPADRRLRIDLVFRDQFGDVMSDRVVGDLLLPEGTSDASKTLYLPISGRRRIVKLNVTERGKRLPQLSSRTILLSRTGPGMGSWPQSDASVATAIVSYEVPSIYTATTHRVPQSNGEGFELSQLSMNRFARTILDPRSVGVVNSHVRDISSDCDWKDLNAAFCEIAYLNPSDLPPHMPGLSGIDFLIIELADLQRMSHEAPESVNLLRHWMLAGGNICTTGGGDQFEHLPAIESLLQLAPVALEYDEVEAGEDAGENETSSQRVNRRLTRGGVAFAGVAWCFPRRRPGRKVSSRGNLAPADFDFWLENSRFAGTEQVPFLTRPAQAGRLIVVPSDHFELSDSGWQHLMISIGSGAWDWRFRYRNEFEPGASDAQYFLIPGIGLPPVKISLVLITVFAILIGPVNYWLLARKKRLAWLLLTVPLGSFVTVGAIAIFGLFADGLSVRARIQSATLIDQRTENSVCFSRQAYYAGIAPRKGLVFPADAIVFSMPPVSVGGLLNSVVRRTIEYDKDLTRYTSGYFESRTTTRSYVAQSQATKARVEISKEDSTSRTIENHLGTRIIGLIYRNGKGEYFHVSDLDNGATGTLAPLASVDDATKEWISWIPSDETESRKRWAAGRGRNSGHLQTAGSKLDQIYSVFRSDILKEMTRDSYIAWVEDPVDVALGVENAIVRRAECCVIGQL